MIPGAGVALNHPYLKSQLIAYIGNKRSLQGFLAGVFRRLQPDSGGRVFLDPFAGSGAVSRLARHLGFRVLANDWELYAYVLNYAHLCVGKSESAGLFGGPGGLSRIFAELNGLGAPRPADQYIARHYAPAVTASADYRAERLFYTRENALRIDAVRSRIEALYPGFDLEGQVKKEKLLLLAALLYQSATHTNTSGVFKACHKGFGGHGRDALVRIMAPVQLQIPELSDGPEAEAGCSDAAEFSRGRTVDLCYLDPPYNQHQYGSNYHLLNTIARWDRPAISGALRPDGRLRFKAGIRADWVQTRSPYCYRRSASGAFRELLEAIDARQIVISYSSGGIVPLEELVDMLARQGRVSLLTNDYVAYRGGRQSIARQANTQEFALVLERDRKSSAVQLGEFRRLMALNRLRLLLKRSFHPRRIGGAFPTRDGGIVVELSGRSLVLKMRYLYQFAPEAGELVGEAAEGELGTLAAALEDCLVADLREEAEVLISMLGEGGGRLALSPQEFVAVQRRILQVLRKYAHRKYRESFEATVEQLRRLSRDAERRGAAGELQVLDRGLPGIEALARARLEG